MNKLNINIDSELAIIDKYNLSPNELFFTKILLLAQEDYPENYLLKFVKISENIRGSLIDLLYSLQNKGIILKSYTIPKKGQKFNPNEVKFNQNVLKTFYRSAFEMGVELFELYPMFGLINGLTVSLRGISKKFNSLEDFYRFYGKSISWNPEKHKHILDLIDWAKNNTGFLNMSISTFVIEHKWEELEVLKNGNGDVSNINYNSIQFI